MTFLPKDKPAAIVLCKTVTGLATVRSLGQAGVDVHAVIFEAGDPVRFSRHCRNIHLHGKEKDEAALLDFLIPYSRKLGNRPVVFPTSDALALFLAKNFEALDSVCRIWTTKHADLLNIVSKDGLYRNAAMAGVRTVPAIMAPDLNEVSEWSRANPGPYLIKPFYTGIATSRLHEAKNVTIPTREMLLAYVAEQGTASVIIQRVIRGGDGYIIDCYGLCDRNGRLLTLASRRRLRQSRPDFGTCTYGEIPSGLDGNTEASMFHDTERLFDTIKYHGMFDIEWLLERDTGKLYLIDFNARPAMGIGGLTDSGLNLPALAYSELIDDLLSRIERTPSLKHKYWVDLLRDMESFYEKYKNRQIGLKEWFVSLLRCRSFAYMDWRDPGPGIHRALTIAGRVLRFVHKTKPTSAAATVSVKRHVTPLAPRAHVPDWWEPLYEASRNRSVFLSGAWLQSWLEVYGGDFKGFWIRWEHDDAVVGGCLLLSRTIRKEFVWLRSLYLNATGEAVERTPTAEFNDILHLPGFDAAISTDFALLVSEMPWSRLLISGHEDRGLINHVIPVLPAIAVERDLKPAPFIDLAAMTHGSFDATLSRNTRSQILRSRRLYEEELGRLTINVASSLEQAMQFLGDMARLHNSRWQSKGESGSFASPIMMDFHRRLIACLWTGKTVDLIRVRAGETVVGYLYNFTDRGKVYFFQSGFVFGTDPRLKPGLIVHCMAIEFYRERGFCEYDFLAGEARYKRSLAKQHRDLNWTVIYRDRPLIRFLLWIRQIRNRLVAWKRNTPGQLSTGRTP